MNTDGEDCDSLVPPMIVMLCKVNFHPTAFLRTLISSACQNPAVQDYDLSSVRNMMVGAAPLSSELTQKIIRIFPASNIFQGYGLTETATTVTMGPLTQQVNTFGSAGQLLPGVVIRVVKPDGSYGTFKEEGEIVIRSPSIALRYSNNEEA
jgi:4-coumarate--CoA ligase